MNARVKKMWVAALRSGKYQQGKGALRRVSGEMCCLGVLCEIHRKETGDGRWIRDGSQFRYHGAGGTLPRAIQVWAGLNSDSPRILPIVEDETDIVTTAAAINDTGVPFADIADMIEAHL